MLVGSVDPHPRAKIPRVHELPVHQQDAHIGGRASDDDGGGRGVIRLLRFRRRSLRRDIGLRRRSKDDRPVVRIGRVVLGICGARGSGCPCRGEDDRVGSGRVLIQASTGRRLRAATRTHGRNEDDGIGRRGAGLGADRGAGADLTARTRTPCPARTATGTTAARPAAAGLADLRQVRQAELPTLRAKDAEDREHRRGRRRDPRNGDDDRNAHRVLTSGGAGFGKVLELPADVVDVLLLKLTLIGYNAKRVRIRFC